jgi:hypothetical protein
MFIVQPLTPVLSRWHAWPMGQSESFEHAPGYTQPRPSGDGSLQQGLFPTMRHAPPGFAEQSASVLHHAFKQTRFGSPNAPAGAQIAGATFFTQSASLLHWSVTQMFD